MRRRQQRDEATLTGWREHEQADLGDFGGVRIILNVGTLRIFNEKRETNEMNPSDRVRAIVTKFGLAVTLSPAATEADWAAWLEGYAGYEARPETTAARVCVVCGAKMVEQVGKFGQFWGCSKYPKCKYTENIKEKSK